LVQAIFPFFKTYFEKERKQQEKRPSGGHFPRPSHGLNHGLGPTNRGQIAILLHEKF